MRAAGLRPLEPYRNAGHKWKCRCLICGNIVYPMYSNINSGHKGCQFCAGNKMDLRRAFSLMKKAKLKPLVDYPGSQKPWKSECLRCHKVVKPALGSIIAGQGGCAYCAKVKMDPIEAQEIMENAGLIPQSKFPGGNSPWKSKCNKCRNFVSPTFSDVKRGVRCKYCSGRAVNALEAKKFIESCNVKVLVEFPGTQKPWKSRCVRCRRVIYPYFSAVRGGQNPCKYCAGRAVDKRAADKMLRKAGVIPLVEYPGSTTKWKSRCKKCKKIVYPLYISVLHGYGACKYCSEFGFGYDEPAIVYLITNPKKLSHKIGIAGVNTHRLKDHARAGWILYAQKRFSTGEEAFAVEQKTLGWLRDEIGLSAHLGRAEMPYGGYTETFDAGLINLSTIWAKVCELSKLKK